MTDQEIASNISKAESLASLKKQRDDLDAKIEKERGEALAEIVSNAKSQAEMIGVSLAELIVAIEKEVKPVGIKKTLPAQFRNPSNPTEEWCGIGRKPKWLETYLKGGTKLEDLKIK